MRSSIRLFLLYVALSFLLKSINGSQSVFGQDQDLTPQSSNAAKSPSDHPRLRPWLRDFADATREAVANHRLLLVRIGGQSCAWCKELETEIAKPEVQAALADWTLVSLDVDQNEIEVRKLGIGPIPALRMFNPQGRVIRSHDGYLPAAELIALLADAKTAARAVVDDAVFTEDALMAADVPKLIEQFRSSRPAVRDASLGQLYRHPKEAREPVIESLFQNSLAARLGAFELLDRWKAPLTGVDPWRKETLSEAVHKSLTDWAATPLEIVPITSVATSAQLASASATIDRLLAGSDEDAAAMREQLAYLGESLLPEVRQRMAQSVDDHSRQRLSALRYRLLASDSLVLRWPNGIDRLAALDSPTRRQAADELVIRAKSSDKALLVELFGDADAMVREISLRAIEHVGGSLASETLVKMLADPEPNVQAAILKQLAQKPMAGLVGPVSEYVAKEKDPDLIVYAIRFLATSGTSAAHEAIIKLLEHPSWQVRAEAVQALRKDQNAAAAVAKLLDDPEPFVVAKALEVLGNNNVAPTVALIRTANSHAALAPSVIKMLVEHKDERPAAAKYLHEFAKHADPSVRAAAVEGLAEVAPNDCKDEILAALAGGSSKVRIAAANGVFKLLDDEWPKKFRNDDESSTAQDIPFSELSSAENSGGAFFQIFRLLSNLGSTPQTTPPASRTPASEHPAEAADEKSTDPPEKPSTVAGPTAALPTPAPAPEPATESKAKPQIDVDPAVAKGTAIDEWLAKHRQSEHRNDWLAKTVEPLKKMTKSALAEERVAAARALIPLGDDDAVAQLPAEVISTPTFVPELSTALHWLPSEKRLEVYDKLMPAVRSNSRLLSQLLTSMAEIRDQTSAPAVWRVLSQTDDLSDGTLQTAFYAAHSAFFPQGVYYRGNDDSAARLKQYARQIEALKPHVAEGSEAQRLLALVLLSEIDPPTAGELAEPMLNDAKLSRKMKGHLFRLVLVGLTKAERHERAVAALAAGVAEQRLTALHYLAFGSRRGLADPDQGFYWISSNDDEEFTAQPFPNLPIRVPFATKELKPRDVRPLLTEADHETAALAGYLLALMGEPEGLAPLMNYWRGKKQKDDEIVALVYRALAVTDDARYLPIVEEIYGQLHESDNMGDFYWTIRMMHCEGILELRARIRKEVDSSKLQSSRMTSSFD